MHPVPNCGGLGADAEAILKLSSARNWFAAILAACLVLHSHRTVAQEYTQGDCSPIVKNVGGNVSIICNFQGQIPIFRFSATIEKTNAHAATAALYDFIERNGRRIFELELDIAGSLTPPSYCNWMTAPSNTRCDWPSYAYEFYEPNQRVIVEHFPVGN
jgi:hypothetical protein